MKQARERMRRRVKGSLTLVATVLILSAALRISGNAGQALALNVENMAGPPDEMVTDQVMIIDDDSLEQMLIALQKREANLNEKEEMIQGRVQALQKINAEVSRKIEQMEKVESQLRSTLTIAETAAEEDILKLTQVYENMKPKQAAELFEEMDPNFAAGFLGRMRPDAAAAIMAGLSAEAANLYSVILAGRNASAPQE